MRVYRKVRYVELHTQQARYDTYIYVLNFIYCATSREKSAHWNSGMGIAGRCRLFQINPQKLGVPSWLQTPVYLASCGYCFLRMKRTHFAVPTLSRQRLNFVLLPVPIHDLGCSSCWSYDFCNQGISNMLSPTSYTGPSSLWSKP